MIVVDTGPVVAMANRRDQDHARCTELLTSLAGPLLLPEPLLTEIGYMMATRAGPHVEADFLRDVADGAYRLTPLTTDDLHRVADLVESYSDLPLGTADACVVAVAERFGITEIATLNHRDFMVVKPRHIDYFTLLPSSPNGRKFAKRKFARPRRAGHSTQYGWSLLWSNGLCALVVQGEQLVHKGPPTPPQLV